MRKARYCREVGVWALLGGHTDKDKTGEGRGSK